MITKKNLFLSRGFSLAEVTMSLGIIATGILSLAGLMPSGLDSLRQSSSRVGEANIVQAVAADCQMTGWGSRAAGQDPSKGVIRPLYYFDERGAEVKASDPWKHYTVQVLIEGAPAKACESPDLEGNRYLRRLTIRVTDSPDGAAVFEEGEPRRYREYGSLIALVEQTDSAIAIIK